MSDGHFRQSEISRPPIKSRFLESTLDDLDVPSQGGLLLAAYNDGNLLRPTEDIDFNGATVSGDIERLRAALITVLSAEAPDDGVEFLLDTMRIKKDRDGIVPGGKIAMVAKVDTARVELKVDVGFGNPVTPEIRMIEFPTILDGITPRPVMRSYPLETVIAEKLHAMAQFGEASTRFKDYYDIWHLSQLHEFDADTLADAVQITFSHQRREIPEAFSGLGPRFAANGARGWNAFISKLPGASKQEFQEVIADISDFLNPISECARTGNRSGATWMPSQGWKSPAPTL